MMKNFIVCGRALVFFACTVLAFWACGSDDDSISSDWEDSELSSGSNGNDGSSGSNLSGSSRSSSSGGDTPYSAVKINYSASDSNGYIVDSRDSSVYGTLRSGPYIWMSSNVSGNIYGVYNVCYDGNTKNCDKYGRLFVGNSGNACPSKFRLPTRSELKKAKSDSRIALQYGGTCKKLDELECKGLDSEAYYQVNDGSIFVDYGGESVLFKKSADYNFYSVRCLAFTHIVHKKSELPQCDSALRDVPNDFYVTSLDSGYTCTYSGWSTRYSSDRRKCLNVVDTTLLYAMGDSMFVCRGNYWQQATLKDVGEICDASGLNRIVEFNGTKYFCADTGWSTLTYPSTELGLCLKSNYSKIDLTDKGDKYYCDSTGWTLLKYPETEIGLCVDSVRTKMVLTDKGEKYYCDSTKWTLVIYPSTELGFCVDSVLSKVATTSKKETYVCKSTGWSKASITDVAGTCDSTKYGDVVTFNASEYACRMTNSWTVLSDLELKIGLCTPGKQGTFSFDTTKKEIYKCDSLKWKYTSTSTYMNSVPCNEQNRYDTLKVFSTTYKCVSSGWTTLLSYEHKIGICSESRLDEIAMLDTTYYACKLQNSNYSWVTLKSWEYEFGECPSNNTKRITKQAPNGDYYYCNKGLWSRASLEYFIGTCSKRSEVVKDTVFNGVEYICDSSQVGDNDEWHRMTAADSAGGFCNRALVGKMMAFDDTVYACASIDVFNRTAFTQEEMKANIVKAKKIWVIASDSLSKVFRYNEIKNALGKCTSARLNETYKNDYLEIVCSSDGLWHGKTTTFTDSRDGQVYKQTTIGTQTWMADNLRYNLGSDQTWCPNKEESKCRTHGRLYRWHSAMGLPASRDSSVVSNMDSIQQGICPTGWRLPLLSDWKILSDYIMKRLPRLDTTYTGKYHPEEPFLLSTNDLFGFNNQRGGYVVYFYRNGIDPDVDMYTNAEVYWTPVEGDWKTSEGVTTAYSINMHLRNEDNPYQKTYGFYVRCIKK